MKRTKNRLIKFIVKYGIPRNCHLRNANLQGANLQGANLQYAKLQGANLRYAKLQDANLQDANLQDANLRYAKLQDANLQYANLQYANLRSAKLQDTNLSGVTKLYSQIDLLKQLGFKFSKRGLVVYKSFSENYYKPAYWKNRKILRENVLFNRTINCACGVNVATLKWCERQCNNQIFKCLIKWKWLMGICVPYNSDGKIRAERVKILEEVGV